MPAQLTRQQMACANEGYDPVASRSASIGSDCYEDIGLVESVQRGMRTPAFQRGRYLVDPDGSGLSEHAVHHFHGLVLDAYRRAGAS